MRPPRCLRRSERHETIRDGNLLISMNKQALSERDICTKFITPALRRAGWDEMLQIREEVSFTKGRIIVRGKLVSRGQAKRADYVLYFKPNIPLALIEAKDNAHSVSDGMQQGLEYPATLDIPFVFSLKRLNGGMVHLPVRAKDRPDRDRLAQRYERFKAAA